MKSRLFLAVATTAFVAACGGGSGDAGPGGTPATPDAPRPTGSLLQTPPVRTDVDVFADTVKASDPLPNPLVPFGNAIISGLLVEAVTRHIACVVTAADRAAPLKGTVAVELNETEYPHDEIASETEKASGPLPA